MTVIRFKPEDVLDCDSFEYIILMEAALEIKGVEGAIVEIGTRRGGSTKLMIDTLEHNEDTDRPFFCIDPYGNIEIECSNINVTRHMPHVPIEGDPNSTEITQKLRIDYTNQMRNRIIPSLYYYAYDKGFNFQFFCMEDSEFFNRFSDGVPVYDQYKTLVNTYALVFFDGPRDQQALDLETKFFIERSTIGTMFVYDDIWMFDLKRYEDMMFEAGFELFFKSEIKASYKRVR